MTHFDVLEQTHQTAGAPAVFDRLIETLRDEQRYHELFDALLMRKRHELGLKLARPTALDDVPPEKRNAFEEYYIECCRHVGKLYLDKGDIPQAWLYLHTIRETKPVTEALEHVHPQPGERTEKLIEIAFQEGANPRKGFELVLASHGTCSAITLLEYHFARLSPDVRRQCAGLLVRQLYGELLRNLKIEIERRQGLAPPENDLAALVASRDWLFEADNYHIDTSHLGAVTRFARVLEDPEDLRLAIALTEYGSRLSPRYQQRQDPPFEDLYADHRVYFRVILGEDVERGLAHFRAKLRDEENGLRPQRTGNEKTAEETAPAPSAQVLRAAEEARQTSAQVLVELLTRIGRYDEAIDLTRRYLMELPPQKRFCPTLIELCELAGRYEPLREAAREKNDLLQFAAALVEADGTPNPRSRT